MNLANTQKISNQTLQSMPDGSTIALQFRYPANFKIGDQLEVTAPVGVMELFGPQHEEGCFKFDIQIWDDQFRLHCDHQQKMAHSQTGDEVYTFKIREIELFPNGYNAEVKTAGQHI